MMHEKYDPQAIEGKWQEAWEVRKTFEVSDPQSGGKPKFYCLCMFPYPSGAIHMGHIRNYSIGDVISRYKRMRGFHVLQPIGWDAFGLPAENAAIQRGVHPREWTLQNISQMKVELKRIGISYDWSREIATCLPEYYKWEQSLFRRFYEEGLAYKKRGTVNWCPNCETVLANEQVQDGKCWRCDGDVVQKDLSQWYFKITEYADELLEGHKLLEKGWPARVLEMQRHWIGESQGARIQFPVDKSSEKIEVFTTRADTLFGVTFVTVAPGHPLTPSLCVDDDKKSKAKTMKATQRAETTEKNGFFSGSYAVHPLTENRVPIWVGDFVVSDYGTGAVMGVPAHDQRDFEFATKYSLDIKRVIAPVDGIPEGPMKEAFTEAGALVNSGPFDGLPSGKAKDAIAAALEKKSLGTKTIQYRLRDWGISRQRYWGAPVPVIYCDKDGVVLVPEKDLPVTLPTDVQFSGKGGNPLEHHPTFSKTTCPKCGGPAKRETDTMDTFVESSWYYARFASPGYDRGPFDKAAADKWLPVDTYIGGIEHACMHLLYSRFFHKVLRDWGYLSGDEPFMRLLSQGMVIKDGAKMSKSKGNVVTPASIIDRFGADTARLFSLFAAPPEKDLDWNDKGVEGCYRFVMRLWRLFFQFQIAAKLKDGAGDAAESEGLLKVRRKTHWTIRKMTEDLESEKFNTAISAAMELVNEIYGLLDTDSKAFDAKGGKRVVRDALEALVLCMAPFTPHLCEELWQLMGHQTLVAEASWPKYDPSLLAQETFLLVVQVNGKVREKIEVPKGTQQGEIQKMVMDLPKVRPFIEGKTLRQFIYVPERIANVVVA